MHIKGLVLMLDIRINVKKLLLYWVFPDIKICIRNFESLSIINNSCILYKYWKLI